MKEYKYRNHTIIRTNTTTDVYIRAPIGHRMALRQLYRIEGEHSTGPSFTRLKDAKEYITEQINMPCGECGGFGSTVGFLGRQKVVHPCSKGCTAE